MPGTFYNNSFRDQLESFLDYSLYYFHMRTNQPTNQLTDRPSFRDASRTPSLSDGLGSYWAHGKVALVIGNSEYEQHSQLTGVNKDVGTTTDLLRNQLGFEVMMMMMMMMMMGTEIGNKYGSAQEPDRI